MEKLHCCSLCDSGVDHDPFTYEGVGCGADASVEIVRLEEAEPGVLTCQFECRHCSHWWTQCVGVQFA
jgi:hypothetical protein